MRSPKERPNFLDAVVMRRIDHEILENGRVVLLRPKFMTGPLRRWLQPRLSKPHFRVRLDEIGSATWLLIDGERSVGSIADTLAESLGDKIEPRYERVASFVKELLRGKMVRPCDRGKGSVPIPG